MTAEALSQAFWRVDETILLGFEELARDHEVRVAYYVRPQHTAIGARNGWFWSNGGETETYTRARVREVFEELDIAESPSIRRSHLILQQYCHDLFESENAELIRRFEWPTCRLRAEGQRSRRRVGSCRAGHAVGPRRVGRGAPPPLLGVARGAD